MPSAEKKLDDEIKEIVSVEHSHDPRFPREKGEKQIKQNTALPIVSNNEINVILKGFNNL